LVEPLLNGFLQKTNIPFFNRRPSSPLGRVLPRFNNTNFQVFCKNTAARLSFSTALNSHRFAAIRDCFVPPAWLVDKAYTTYLTSPHHKKLDFYPMSVA